jgi:3-oxoacyl-[acyl-carrier-protein] synthase II
MSSPRRAVITGVGVVCPLGLDVSSFWEGLRQGRCGVGAVTSFDVSALPIRIGAEVRGFDARNYLEKKERKRLGIMVRTFQFAVAAAQLAMEDGMVDRQALDPMRLGVVVGSATIPGDLRDLGPGSRAACEFSPLFPNLATWGEKSIPLVPPLWMLTHIPNMMACHISILHNAQGPNNTITQTDVAGLLTVGEACRYIARDRADMVLVGGADCNLAVANFLRHNLFDHLSRRNEDPEKASRPFDRDRDGLVLGEGGGILIVEELEHALRRKARIYAEVTGFAAGFGTTSTGLTRVLRQALVRAKLAPEAIGHINAQGNSTIGGDALEARAIAEVFGPQGPPVFAGKGALGHLGAASGSVELAASLLALQQGVLPRTVNYDNPAPECPISVTSENAPVQSPHFLKIGFTEMGQCAAVVCKKWG